MHSRGVVSSGRRNGSTAGSSSSSIEAGNQLRRKVSAVACMSGALRSPAMALSKYCVGPRCAAVLDGTSRSIRSGTWMPSHCATMPPARCCLGR
jgi:hypothetical protein